MGRRSLLNTPGAELEVESSPGRGGAARDAACTAAVVLHPWGRLGGCMDDPTVTALYQAASSSGLFSTVVRYNQRGAGRSRGKQVFPASRSPHVDDLVAICTHALAGVSGGSSGGQRAHGGGGTVEVSGGSGGAGPPPARLVLLCYSYGSCIAADALARLPAAAAYVSVGFPLGLLSRWFLGSAASWDALAAASVPKLLIMGTADNFTSLPQLRAAVDRHAASAAGSVPMEVRILEGADHFFYERWEEVAAEALSWVAKQLEHVAQDGRMKAAASRGSGSMGSAAAAAATL